MPVSTSPLSRPPPSLPPPWLPTTSSSNTWQASPSTTTTTSSSWQHSPLVPPHPLNPSPQSAGPEMGSHFTFGHHTAGEKGEKQFHQYLVYLRTFKFSTIFSLFSNFQLLNQILCQVSRRPPIPTSLPSCRQDRRQELQGFILFLHFDPQSITRKDNSIPKPTT